ATLFPYSTLFRSLVPPCLMSVTSLALARQQYEDQREVVAQAYAHHRNPQKLLTQNRQLCDQLLQALLKQKPLPAGACHVAVGGYGRQEMFPQSDVDLLILLEHPATSQDKLMLENW